MAMRASRLEELTKLQAILNYTFKNQKFLEEALTHDSNRVNDRNAVTYQRLEFLGDSVLNLVISDYLYRENPTYGEGQLTTQRKELTEGLRQTQVAKKINIQDYIVFGQSVRKNEFSRCHSFVESLIGAVYMDGGYSEAAKVIFRLWDLELPSHIQGDAANNGNNCVLS